MSHLRLRHDVIDASEANDERESLPFPTEWRKEADDASRLAAELLDAAETTEDLERTIVQMQEEIDELREELTDALHLYDNAGWRPPAA